ncbi:MAG: hypothetical protein HQ526_05985 [Actinobacteria bacterium]|nr:hypothetical protein [Actinomycetota bacterium]
MGRSRRTGLTLILSCLLALPVIAANPAASASLDSPVASTAQVDVVEPVDLVEPVEEPIPDPARSAVGDPLDEPIDSEPFNLQGVAVAALRENPPFFQISRAPLAVAPNEVSQVTTALNNAGTPMFVTILPGSTGYAAGFSREVSQAMGLPGTYLSIIGTVFDTYSTEIDSQAILTRAYTEKGPEGTAAVIIRFAELSGLAAQGPLPTPDMVAWRPTLIFVGSVFAIGLGFLLIRSKSPEDPEPEPTAGAVEMPAP